MIGSWAPKSEKSGIVIGFPIAHPGIQEVKQRDPKGEQAEGGERCHWMSDSESSNPIG